MEDDDKQIVRFKGGPPVLDKLAENLSRIGPWSSEHLFNACSAGANLLDGSAMLFMADQAFRNLAIYTFSRNLDHLHAGILHHFAPMCKVEGATQFKQTTSQATLPSPFLSALSVTRTVQKYEGLRLTNAYEEDNCKRLYVLQASDSSLFDAFFYHPTPTAMELYILQTTVRRTVNSAATGFETVERLVDRVLQAGHSTIEVNYVLVVPHALYGQDIVWDMGQEYSKAKGNVCIQFLRIGSDRSVY